MLLCVGIAQICTALIINILQKAFDFCNIIDIA